MKPGDLFFALAGERFDGHNFVAQALAQGAAAVVVQRDPAALGLSAEAARERCLLVPDTYRALGDLARWHVQRWDGQVVAVTGSNGKTTTKDMIHHALSARFSARKSPASFNNCVGLPHSIFQLEADDRIAVLEMGTSALGEIRRLAEIACPQVGVVTNIGETHLESLGSLKGVAHAKAELLEVLPQGGVAILNADDPMTPFLRSKCGCDVLTFGAGDAAIMRAARIRLSDWSSEFVLRDGTACRLPVPGRHNVFNALAAIACCVALGMRAKEAAERLQSFAAAPMRMAREVVAEVTILNDAYNANLRSMQAALEVVTEMPAGRRVMLCGDMLELGPRALALHRDLGRCIADSGVRVLVTVGPWAAASGEVARRGSGGVEVYPCDDPMQAADRLGGLLRPRDVLLVKGSRALRLELAVEKIKAALMQREPPRRVGADSVAAGVR